MTAPALELAGLSHHYVEGRPVLDNLSFEVGAGEIFGLLGPNGGGKTTLFRILSTLIRPAGGRASIFGADAAAEPAAVRRLIGVVFQSPSLDRKLTVEENLRHQGHLYGLSGSSLRRRIDELMVRLRIADRRHDLVEILSGGLQRRVEIAKGLLHNPRLLLMDEPTTGLDPGSRRDVWDLLAELRADGMTILLTTHLMEEGPRCNRLAILHRGRCVAIGTPAELTAAIGGDVITVATTDASGLASRISESLGVEAAAVDGAVRIETPDGHKMIPRIVEAFPGAVSSVSVGKPTLEDVFLHSTGLTFFGAEHAGAA